MSSMEELEQEIAWARTIDPRKVNEAQAVRMASQYLDVLVELKLWRTGVFTTAIMKPDPFHPLYPEQRHD
jgi:hypothetical protein